MNDLARRYRFERDLSFRGLLDEPLVATCVGAPAGDDPRAFRLELRVTPAAWRRIWAEGLFHLNPLAVADGAALPPATDPASADDAPVRLAVELHPALLGLLEPGEEGDKAVLEGLLGPDQSLYDNAFAWRARGVLWRDDANGDGDPGDGHGDVYVGWETEWVEEA